MKPRQTVKNYHNTNAPPYQNNQTSSTTPSLPALRDIDLVKLGLDLDDMPNLQASSSTNVSANQEEIVKCLHAIYGKGSAEILQKLPALNDWSMQSLSPPDYSRLTSCSNNTSIGSGGNGSVNVLGMGGATNFSSNNNISSSNNIKQQQELQFSNSSQLSHQTTSAINHHFRVSSSNIHSPQQSQQPQQQQKSVLSLHQHHQNDLSNRRLNHHQQMSKTNASFTNLNTMSASNATSTSTSTAPSSSSLDTSNVSALGSSLGSKNSSPVVVGPHMSSIMDTFSSLDNIFYDNASNSMLLNKDPSLSNQQSLMKHQQLQKLLKVTGNQLKSASLPSSTATLPPSHRNDSQTQRNTNNNNMPQSQHQLSSPASTKSPPQPTALSSVPKSLLNLAACSSSANTSSLPPTSKYSSMVNQLNLMSAKQSNSNMANSNSSNSKSFLKNTFSNTNNAIYSSEQSNHRSINGNDLSNAGSQQLTNRFSAASSTQTGGSSNKSNSKQSIQLSLLSDDQFTRNPSSIRPLCNSSENSSKLSPQSQGQNFPNVSMSSKEAYIASLQERAARAGISIGEINKPIQSTSATSLNPVPNIVNVTHTATSNQKALASVSPDQVKDDFNATVDRKEIESALSRVGARNDLSLLYPPLLLASNSQKQINALSAGLQNTDDSELFTKEVKKIVLEECNIIYECKECNNLFRSLANLVKHKRTYCTERHLEHNSVDLNKRPYSNTMSIKDQRSLTTTIPVCESPSEQDTNLDTSNTLTNRLDDLTSTDYSYLKNSEIRSNNQSNMIRLIQNQERDLVTKMARLQKSQNNRVTNVTNLSKLLRSQPRSRTSVSRDSALLDALNIPSSSTLENNQLSAFESDKICTTQEVHEQLVRNSSLAKTLLNEKVKVNNPRQSLIELSKAELILNRANNSVPKRVAPKRKFLEDCIQKVKRDKLFTEDEDEMPAQTSVDTSNSIMMTVGNFRKNTMNNNSLLADREANFQHDTPKSDNAGESDLDSNMLMIDLDTPKKRTSLKKAAKKVRNIPSTSGTSTLSVNKLTSSSALLKALTRPVDKRPQNTVATTNEEHTQQRSPRNSCMDVLKSKEAESEQERNIPEKEVSIPLCDRQTCDICEEDHENLDSLLKHLVLTHKVQKMVYPCIFCSLSFITLENVCRHILDIHQKPKTQVQRLKEVVRSRSYLCSNSSEFLSCRDYPHSLSMEDWEKDSEILDQVTNEDVKLDEDSKKPENLSQFEGMQTRGKKRVDYNQMVRNESSEESSLIKIRKIRSRSIDQTASTSIIQDEVCEKAASIDGHSLDVSDDSALDNSFSLFKKDDVIQTYTDQVVDEKESSLSESCHDNRLEFVTQEESQEEGSLITEKEEIDLEKGVGIDDSQNSKHSFVDPNFPEESNVLEAGEDKTLLADSSVEELQSTSITKESDKIQLEEVNDDEEEILTDDSSNEESSSDSSSQHSSSSSSSSSSGNSSSESSSSSSSSSSSGSSSSAASVKSHDKTAATKDSPHFTKDIIDSFSVNDDAKPEAKSSLKSKTDEPSQARNDFKASISGKQIFSTKEFSGPSLSPPDNGSSSENLGESEGVDYDSTPPHESDKEKTTSDLTKQSNQQQSPSIKPTLETTPSASSTNAGGGIMKLKIQLKTRPDEKSKVYEIV